MSKHWSHGMILVAALTVAGCEQCEEWGALTLIHTDRQTSAQAILGVEGGMVMGGAPRYSAVTRLDSAGRTLWSQDLQASRSVGGEVVDVIAATGGGFVVVVHDYSFTQESERQLWVGHLTEDGEPTWETVLGPAHYFAWMKGDVQAHPEGGYVVSWHDSGAGGVGTRLRTARIDDMGTPLWSTHHWLAADSPVPGGSSRGGFALLPSGDALQLTSEAEQPRLVRLASDGTTVSDVVMDVDGWPSDLVVLPDGAVLAAINSAMGPRLLEIEPDGTVVAELAQRSSNRQELHELQWDPVHEVLYVGGVTPDEDGTQRPWTLVLERDGTEIASELDEDLTVGVVYDASPRPEGGFAVVRHGGATLHLELVGPCHELFE